MRLCLRQYCVCASILRMCIGLVTESLVWFMALVAKTYYKSTYTLCIKYFAPPLHALWRERKIEGWGTLFVARETAFINKIDNLFKFQRVRIFFLTITFHNPKKYIISNKKYIVSIQYSWNKLKTTYFLLKNVSNQICVGNCCTKSIIV